MVFKRDVESYVQAVSDVSNSYQLFLGRLPENERVIVEKLGASPVELMLEAVGSNEFATSLAGPVLSGDRSWCDEREHMDGALVAWTRRVFEIDIDDAADDGRSVWRKRLARLFSEPRFQELVVRHGICWRSGTVADLARTLAGLPRQVRARTREEDRILIASWGGFDAEWYRSAYDETLTSEDAAILDYLERGEREGRRPNAIFDPAWVRDRYGLAQDEVALVRYLAAPRDEALEPSAVFDTRFYRDQYGSDLGNAEPLDYYRREGWRRGHDPNPAFDTRWYVDHFGVGVAGDPLSDYLTDGAARGNEPMAAFCSGFVVRVAGDGKAERTALESYLRLPNSARQPNPLFDGDFYRAQARDAVHGGIDAAWHYRRHGYREGYDPSPIFSTADYLDRYPDVRAADIDPLGHYFSSGAAEGRRATALFDEEWYVRATRLSNVTLATAIEHYMTVGHLEGRDPHPLFDTDWYLANYTDVAQARQNPLVHYAKNGWRERRRPNPLFDVDWYLRTYPEVARSGIEPLTHYTRYGSVEGYDPGPLFSTAWYLQQHPESASGGQLPLVHYLYIGRPSGFAPALGRSDPLVLLPGVGVEPPEPLDPYASWMEVNPDSEVADRVLRERLVDAQGRLPLVSVVMPCYDTDLSLLAAAIGSVREQLYADWELCICDDASPDPRVGEMLRNFAAADIRIRLTRAEQNLGIGGATNAAAALASGDVIALLDHDDLLHPHALGEIALAYGNDTEVDIVYSDDDKIGPDGHRYNAQFKPGWSPVLLLSYMYISHLFTFRRALFIAVGGVRAGFDGSQDYDLALRLSEQARKVVHVPRMLYHWRAVEGSTATGGNVKPLAFERGRRAVQDALDRRGIVADVVQAAFGRASNLGVFEPGFPDDGPSVTIIIPTRNKVDLLQTCIESLRRTTYRNFDVLILDNDSDDEATLAYIAACGARILQVGSPAEGFSFAHLMNAGVAAATGEYVLLLNNDTEVRTPRWLSQMMGYARMPGVGAVGARLLYGDHRLQHAGIVHGLHEGMAGHAFKLLPDWDLGYMQMAHVSREVAAVTAACLLTSKRVYESVGGLDEATFRVAYNDVDFCYRLAEAGYTCIQCGSAELFHYEGQSRGFVDNPAEITAMRQKYGAKSDLYYNPNLTLEHEQFEIARTHVAFAREKPVRTVFVSHNFNHEGAPNSLYELATGLRDAGRVDPLVISPTDGPLMARYAAESVPAHVVESPLATWPPADQFAANIRRMAQAFLYAGAEVIVANTADSFWAVEAARQAKLPCLWIIRESEPWQTYFTHFPKHIADAAYNSFEYPYRVIFVARATMDAWKPLDSRGSFTLNRNGLDSEKMIASFTDLRRDRARETLDVNENACVFMCVGTVAERKGQIDIVRAFALLNDDLARGALIVIIGDRASPYSDRLHAEVDALPADKRARVRIIGETGQARSFLVGADVFICSSRVESYPRVTLEAMAAGLPLITTGVWGIREQVRPDYNARMYEPGDVEALTAHLAEMIQNPALRARFAARSAPVFRSLPDFRYMRDRYAALIDQAVGSV